MKKITAIVRPEKLEPLKEALLDVYKRQGSSLGAVEIILAVHSMLDCPRDRFIFDVGHQAYAHKLVTGRLDEFKSLRTYGGLSGLSLIHI